MRYTVVLGGTVGYLARYVEGEVHSWSANSLELGIEWPESTPIQQITNHTIQHSLYRLRLLRELC